ncbi:cytochrome c1 [Erythrobacter sp. F6033]|uniref:cytochrome c1 n=1 Tax=Erythrobacter sp. F6033 TaxID=2926401 RepID=UPI001FF1B59A|nr:cytochrome c1 [Erythrobacter sp. F6033]MCK0129864.1 cytochrome c1 [Erythrobacter sp. F6033]
MTIRLAGILAGIGITAVLVFWSLVPGVVNLVSGPPAEKSAYYVFKEKPVAPEGGFSFAGPVGKWDYAQLQRGYSIYKQVCSACHGLKYVAFRNLEELGYSEEQVRAEAATWPVPGIDPNTGEAVLRPGLPTDYFPNPYPNNVAAAAANNNAIPPDLTLMTKARKDGSNYVYSLLNGYVEPDPEKLAAAEANGFETPEGLYFNPWFENVNLAMAPQLVEGAITYDDGTEATVPQMSADIAAFLTWTAEPTLIKRKQTGWAVILFLLFATSLAYMSYKQVWAGQKPKKK